MNEIEESDEEDEEEDDKERASRSLIASHPLDSAEEDEGRADEMMAESNGQQGTTLAGKYTIRGKRKFPYPRGTSHLLLAKQYTKLQNSRFRADV